MLNTQNIFRIQEKHKQTQEKKKKNEQNARLRSAALGCSTKGVKTAVATGTPACSRMEVAVVRCSFFFFSVGLFVLFVWGVCYCLLFTCLFGLGVLLLCCLCVWASEITYGFLAVFLLLLHKPKPTLRLLGIRRGSLNKI